MYQYLCGKPICHVCERHAPWGSNHGKQVILFELLRVMLPVQVLSNRFQSPLVFARLFGSLSLIQVL